MKKIINRAMVAGLLAATFSLAYATVTYVQSFKVGGSYVWILENTGATTQTGPQKFGSSVTGSAITMPTTTTGSNFATWVPVFNVTTAVTQGDALVPSALGVGYVTKAAATSNLTNVVGVAAESIAASASGWMIPRGGGWAVVHTTGTVNLGDVLVTTVSASGYLTGNNSPAAGTAVAIAESTGTSAGGSVIAIMR